MQYYCGKWVRSKKGSVGGSDVWLMPCLIIIIIIYYYSAIVFSKSEKNVV